MVHDRYISTFGWLQKMVNINLIFGISEWINYSHKVHQEISTLIQNIADRSITGIIK